MFIGVEFLSKIVQREKSGAPGRPLFWFDYRLLFIKALIRYGLPDPRANNGNNRNRLIGSPSSEPPLTVHSLRYTGDIAIPQEGLSVRLQKPT